MKTNMLAFLLTVLFVSLTACREARQGAVGGQDKIAARQENNNKSLPIQLFFEGQKINVESFSNGNFSTHFCLLQNGKIIKTNDDYVFDDNLVDSLTLKIRQVGNYAFLFERPILPLNKNISKTSGEEQKLPFRWKPQKIIFYDSTFSNSIKVLELESNNPYSKIKLKNVQYEQLFDAEIGNSPHYPNVGYDYSKDIARYWTYNMVETDDKGYIHVQYMLYPKDKQGKLLDQLMTYQVFYPGGRTLLDVDEKRAIFSCKIIANGKYAAFHCEPESANDLEGRLLLDRRESFAIMDIKTKKIIHNELIDITHISQLSSVWESDVQLLRLERTIRNNDQKPGSAYAETVIFDFQENAKYSRTFTNDEMQWLTENWVREKMDMRKVLKRNKFLMERIAN